MNTKEEILKLVKKEEIEAILIGKEDCFGEVKEEELYEKDKIPEALKKLNFEFDDETEEGYIALVWTKDWIIIHNEYEADNEGDGVYNKIQWYNKIPRNPKGSENDGGFKKIKAKRETSGD